LQNNLKQPFLLETFIENIKTEKESELRNWESKELWERQKN
jgi:hypothetical protein